MFNLAPTTNFGSAQDILILCRILGIHNTPEELALALNNAEAALCDPRKATIWRIAAQMNALSRPEKTFSCTADALAERAKKLDWASPRFFGYDAQIGREAAYLLPAPLTMDSDFLELVFPLIEARTRAGRFPHIPPLFVALIEAFLWRCVVLDPALHRHFSAIIDTILYAPPNELAISLHRTITTALEADDVGSK